MAVRFRWRKTVRLGPIRWHFTQRGYTGWSVRIGPWTWSAHTGRHSVDTPGPGGITFGRRKRRRV